MLQVNMSIVDTIHSNCNKLVKGMKIKATCTCDLNLYDSSAFSHVCIHMVFILKVLFSHQ